MDEILVDSSLWSELKRLASIDAQTRLFSPEEQRIFDEAALADRSATALLKILWIPVALFCAGAWFSSAVELSAPGEFVHCRFPLFEVRISDWASSIHLCRH
jgi:hypothetical protein